MLTDLFWMKGLSLWASRERTSCWFLSSFLLAQQIDEVRTCHRDETCQTAWNTVVLGHDLSLGVKGNSSIWWQMKTQVGENCRTERVNFFPLGRDRQPCCLCVRQIFWNETLPVLLSLLSFTIGLLWLGGKNASVAADRLQLSGSCGQGEPAGLSHTKPCAGSAGD